ncbi:MAG: gephyrin-like molybdotransferase Glp [Candidatus Thorarchaeota archaeon]
MKEMDPFKLLVSQEEAEALLLDTCIPIEHTEKIHIAEATGRVLAADITADQNVPPFDRAAMDGYAVVAEDTFRAQDEEVLLKLKGVIHAGEVAAENVESSYCLQIATGSPMPVGADAVVMVEYTERRDEQILITRPVYPGANVSKAGEDIKKDEVVLAKGLLLTPARIGTVAALGSIGVEVYRKPRVAVIPTGREIVAPGQPLKPGQIYDVNSFTLESILSTNGAEVERLPVVTDEAEALKSAITSSLGFDLVVLSGGSSVGEKDLLSGIIEELGEVLFHGVQIKPGKPTLFGVVKKTPIVGMPGYPTSCLSNAYIFLIPAIRKMARLPRLTERKVQVRLGKRIVSSSGRKQFLTVRIQNGEAHPVYKHSGAITSMAKADGYIILPVNLDVIDEGEIVEVTLFE